ncbi:hypothetical protein DXG01_007262 [Tephrocybe rancida]|nr:hypothetical protein DXG01_007262 [Tephrocybe rancida]
MSIITSPDLATFRRIEFDAGRSNIIILSTEEIALAKFMIQATDNRITALIQELWDHRLRLERLKKAIAPHKAIPFELLVQIFRHTLSKEMDTYQRAQSPAWTFRQVCSSWRNAVLSEISVWNSLVVPEKNGIKKASFWAQQIFHPSYPLSLTIKSSATSQRAHNSLIKPHHTRFRHLSMYATSRFLSMPHGSFPLLEDLHLTFDMSRLNPNNDFKKASWSGMKSLRSLHISFGPISRARRYAGNFFPGGVPHVLPSAVPDFLQGPIPDFLVQLRVPWTQLTSLALTLSLDGLLSVLKSSPHIEHAHLIVASASVRPTCSAVSLPRLTSFTIDEEADWEDFNSILRYLTMPALIFLDATHQLHTDILFAFMARSRCVLRVLRVARIFNASLIAADLYALRTLHELHLARPFFPEELILKIAEGLLLPNIESLSIEMTGMDLGVIESLAQLVRNRWCLSRIRTVASRNTPPPVRRVFVLADNFLTDAARIQAVKILSPIIEYGTMMKVHDSHGIVFETGDWVSDKPRALITR